MKKGISAVFQYILAAVIGGMILLFLISFAYKATSSFDMLSSAYVENTLKDSLVSLTVSEFSSTIFPERGWSEDVDFKIGDKENCGKIAVDEIDYLNTGEIIYGPLVMNGRTINVWTKGWNYPYEVGNFFYVTNKKTKYYLVYHTANQAFVDELDSFASPVDPLDHIPRKFNVKAIPNSVVNENYVDGISGANDFVKFVFFNNPPNIIRRKNVEVVRIDINNCDNDYLCKGKVFFEGNARDFYGKAMLYGAIFAGSLEQYDCNFDDSMEMIKAVSEVYKKKAKLFSDKTGCTYPALINNVDNIDMNSFAENMIDVNYGDTGACKNIF